MDSFELNKIAAAVLLALLIGMTASMTSSFLIAPKMPDKNVFIVEGITDGLAPIVTAEVKLQPIEPLLASANIENGKRVAKKCLQCHTFDKGGRNMVGPNLYGVVGRKVAQVVGFAYSKAMGSFDNIWSFEHLSTYLHKPRVFVKGTKMAFVGLKKAKDRADVIAYMNSMNDKPLLIPKSIPKSQTP